MNIDRLKEYIKKNLTNRSDEDIKQIIQLTSVKTYHYIQGLKFINEIKNEEMIYDIYKNAELKYFKEDELIYNSEDILSKDENYFIISGTVNLYTIDKTNEDTKVIICLS